MTWKNSYFIELIYYILVFWRTKYYQTGTWSNGYMIIRYTIYGYTGEQVHGRTSIPTKVILANGYMIIRWHNHTVAQYKGYKIYRVYWQTQHHRTGTWSYGNTIKQLHHLRVHGRTGTRANRYMGEQVHRRTGTWPNGYMIIRYTIYGYTGEQVHGRTGIMANNYTDKQLLKIGGNFYELKKNINDWNISFKGSGGYIFQIWRHNMAVHELCSFTILPLNHI